MRKQESGEVPLVPTSDAVVPNGLSTLHGPTARQPSSRGQRAIRFGLPLLAETQRNESVLPLDPFTNRVCWCNRRCFPSHRGSAHISSSLLEQRGRARATVLL